MPSTEDLLAGCLANAILRMSKRHVTLTAASGWRQAAELLGNSPAGVSMEFALMHMSRDLPETSDGNEVRSGCIWRRNMQSRTVRPYK